MALLNLSIEVYMVLLTAGLVALAGYALTKRVQEGA